MSQPATIFDVPVGEVVKLGSQLINFPSQGNLIAEEITFTKEMRSVEFPDALGRDVKAAYSTKRGTGSMVVQFKGTGAVIGAGEIFTLNGYQGGFNIGCIITSVGNIFTQSGAAKIPINFVEYLDGSVLPKSVVYDGAMGSPFAITPLRVRPYNVPGSPIQTFVATQRFGQLGTSWVSTALGTAGPTIEGQATVLVDELETEDAGSAGMITRDLVWAMKPFSWQQSVSVAKNYQIAAYAWNGSNQLTASGIVGYTQTIKGTATYDYYLDTSGVGSLPTVPTLMMISFIGQQVLSDGGTGFPQQNYPFGTGFGSNYGVSFISGSIDPYIGKMMCRKLIYG